MTYSVYSVKVLLLLSVTYLINIMQHTVVMHTLDITQEIHCYYSTVTSIYYVHTQL